jgi:UDP-N-acetylglucosamine 2-epimerase (non-hydrolysing)
MKKKILIIFGTRPEAIKLAPLILALKRQDSIKTFICVTAQHREMLDQVLGFFEITPDIDLSLMRTGQTLELISSLIIERVSGVIRKIKPDCVVVQGDTTTAAMSALAAYYQKVPVAHVEAGLRTHDLYHPFPEEVNRQIISRITAFNFAPTRLATKHLRAEGIKPGAIHITGNTVVDALNLGLRRIASDAKLRKNLSLWLAKTLSIYSEPVKIVLITGHRRESFGRGFEEICAAIKELASRFPSYRFVYPVHLNPRVKKPVYALLGKIPNVSLLDPLDYPRMLYLMSKSFLILTDSGGIQEEAPAFQVPVLVMRTKTERPEGVAAGCNILVGNTRRAIVRHAEKILRSPVLYRSMQCKKNPFGDGKASDRIVKILNKNVQTPAMKG